MIVMLFKFRLMQSFRLDFALSVLLGVMIPPQVFGRVIFGLLEKEFKPKDFIPPPPEVFPYPGMMVFNEYSLYRGWMEQYLRYLRWYALLYMKPDLTLDDLLDAPVYIRTWDAPKVDLETFRFGITVRIVDVVAVMANRDIRLLPVDPLLENPL